MFSHDSFNHIERESYKLLKFVINPIFMRAVSPATGSNLSPFPSHFSFLHSQPPKGTEAGQALLITLLLWGKVAMPLPGGSAIKNWPVNAGDAAGVMGSIPESRRSPGEGNGNPLQCSCLGSPMDRRASWATIHLQSMGSQRVRHNLATIPPEPLDIISTLQKSRIKDYITSWHLQAYYLAPIMFWKLSRK